MKLPRFWQLLPDEIKARFGQKRSGKQRAMVADGHLLLVLHKVPQSGKREREGVFFWRKPDGAWESDRGGGYLRVVEHVEEYDAAEVALSREYEQVKNAEDCFALLEKIGPLHHAARSLHATLQAAREGIPHDRDLIDLRDWAYDLERTLELLYADTKNAMDFRIARQAEEEARLSVQSVKLANRLNVLAAIFFPLTALASIFGMNLRSGLEDSPTWMFWLILFAGVLFGAGLSWWVVSLTQMRQPK